VLAHESRQAQPWLIFDVGQKQMNKKQVVLAYVGLCIYAAFPMLCVLLASAIAQATGSRLDEGSAHPCIVFGVDVGGLLYGLFVMGWLSLVTLPTGVLGLIALTIALLVARARGDTKRNLDSLAVVSVVLSSMSVFIGPFGAIPGFICGYAAKKRIAKNANLRGAGVALAGMIVGGIGLAVFVTLMALKHR
jgi:hypothetical protein